MFDRLEQTEARYEELTQALASPDITNDSAKYQKTAKAHSDLVPIVEKFREYKELKKGIEGSKALLASETDPEMRTYAQDELTELEARIIAVEQELKIMLLPKDPNDEKNVILEIRAGTGGDEATLFVAEIFRMYSRFAELQGWKVDVLSSSESSAGGLKEVIAMVEGKRVYSRLKYESGVHRVQRVPETEQQGRVHTSAITVAVLPEAEEVDVKIEAKDLRIDTFCSSGPGGQSVNTTYSAVRITHIPTNIVVGCQAQRSQSKNRELAMKMLRSRLYDLEIQKRQAHTDKLDESKLDISFGSQIRSYVMQPYRLIKDHRTKFEVGDVDRVMDGDLDPFIRSYLMAKKTKGGLEVQPDDDADVA